MKHERLMKKPNKTLLLLEVNFLKMYQLTKNTKNEIYRLNTFKQELLHPNKKDKSKNIVMRLRSNEKPVKKFIFYMKNFHSYTVQQYKK